MTTTLRELEFPHASNVVHLDHAASTLYPRSLIETCSRDLIENMYSNPHSQSTSSIKTLQLVNDTRRKLLKSLFNTDLNHYSVIFTSGATASCKLLSECFFQKQNTQFLYLMNNHNSVLGMREIAKERGSRAHCITNPDMNTSDVQQIAKSVVIESLSSSSSPSITEETNKRQNVMRSLFAYSPECNATGHKIPTNLCSLIYEQEQHQQQQQQQQQNIYVLMDASKYVSTNFLDLSRKENQADFIVFSAYKIFGYPMGVGVLLVKNSSAHVLKKQYFGGGTVSFSVADSMEHKLRPVLHEAFEDGTLPYLNIIALNRALDIVPKLIYQNLTTTVSDAQEQQNKEHYMTLVQKHTFNLSQMLYERLKELKHYNNVPVCVFYGYHHTHDMQQQGSIINFNVRRANGSYVGYGEVSQLASLYSPQINLRTGCFCNPGACQTNLNISNKQMVENFEKGHVCWDGNDIINGNPTGSIRISFGWMSTESDVDTFMQFIRQYFVEESEDQVENANSKTSVQPASAVLTHVIIYPVKSCQGMVVQDSWELVDSGPIYDREWTIIDHQGVALQQKLHPKMACIETFVDLDNRHLILSNSLDPKGVKLYINLDEYPEETVSEQNLKVCGIETKGLIYKNPDISQWLSDILGVDAHLVRKNPNKNRFMTCNSSSTGDSCSQVISSSKINFSNEAQFLLINRSSMDDLNNRLREIYWSEDSKTRRDYSGCCYSNSDWLITRFRPNLVIENLINRTPYEEDKYRSVTIADNLRLTVAGPCNRCSMICVDPIELTKASEPLKTLFGYRRDQGKVLFGILLTQDGEPLSTEKMTISPGSKVLLS